MLHYIILHSIKMLCDKLYDITYYNIICYTHICIMHCGYRLYFLCAYFYPWASCGPDYFSRMRRKWGARKQNTVFQVPQRCARRGAHCVYDICTFPERPSRVLFKHGILFCSADQGYAQTVCFLPNVRNQGEACFSGGG